MKTRGDLLTREELAERFGVDVRTVTRWLEQGMPHRVRSGRTVYAWPQCLAWREAAIREDERALRHAGGDIDRKKDLADARLRTAIAEAEVAELDVAARRGDLVTVDYMAGEFDRIARALRTRLLALPHTWAPRLGACMTTLERQLELQNAINELLPALRELAEDDSGAASTGDAEPLALRPVPASNAQTLQD